jgi:cytochrome c biogenesis protein CcdA
MFGQELTLGIVITAALVDSINPCVLGVLIFLIAFMTRVFKSAKKMLIGGLLSSVVVYVTYLVLGLGILKAALSVGVAAGFYWAAAVIAIVAGLLEIKDYFWYGKGFSLQMIPGGAARIKKYTKWLEKMESRHPAFLFLMTALLGIFVVMVELPCTGAPYLVILGLLGQGEYSSAVPLLLLYNFIFVIPLLVVIALAYFGTSSDRIEAWRKEHRGIMRLGVGIFLIALGFYMVYSLNPIF